MKKIIVLIFIFGAGSMTQAQIKDASEAAKVLLGGWELQNQYEVIRRDQIYFFYGDSAYRRFTRPVAPKGAPNHECLASDTVTIDKLQWKIIEFNKRKQIAKVAFIGLGRIQKLSCEADALAPSGTLVQHFKFVSKDQIVGRNDLKRFKKIYNRKKDQIHFEPR